MTPDDARTLAEIQGRAEQATPEPWCWEATGEKSNDYAVGTAFDPDGNPVSGRLVTTDDPETGLWMEDAIIRRHHIGDGENGLFADADFIAHARTDVPYLLVLVQRQAGEIARLKAALDLQQWKEQAENHHLALRKRAESAEAQLSQMRETLRTLLAFDDFNSLTVNYCWYCGANINGLEEATPKQPHEPDCIGVKAAALSGKELETR